jgi:hypothetical protein
MPLSERRAGKANGSNTPVEGILFPCLGHQQETCGKKSEADGEMEKTHVYEFCGGRDYMEVRQID